MYYVYGLLDPITNQPFYIGKGSANRYEHHLTESKDNTSNIRKWYKIQKLRNRGFEPKIEIYQYFDLEDDAYEYEEILILKYGRKNYEEYGILTNFCLGSRPPNRRGKKHRSDTKEKMRERALERPAFTAEHKHKLKKARSRRQDKPLTDDVKEKISRSNKTSYWKTDISTRLERHAKISRARAGKSTTGLMSWDIVRDIRSKFKNGITKNEIHSKYKFISRASINDIIAHRTWKE
jgi:hypothetical protein